MMKFVLEIRCDTAAFDADDPAAEVSDILLMLSGVIESKGLSRAQKIVVRDSQGTAVGHANFVGV